MIGRPRRTAIFPRLRVLLGLSLLTALAFILPTPKAASAHLRHFAPKPQDNLMLEPGKPIERRLAIDETHHYRLTLNPDEFLRLALERTTMDVVMTARAPGGEEMSAVDDCYIAGGWQSLLLLAEQAGEYRLEIRAIKQGQGTYRLRLVERREARASDRDRLRAHRLAAEAQQLSRQERADERKRAILKLEEALPILQSLADDNGAAQALFNLGELHDLTGEKRLSLTDFQRALQLYRSANNRRGEAATLIHLGSIHNRLGEKQQAMDYRQEALALWRALGDAVGEAEAMLNLSGVYASFGENRRALDLLQQALANFRAADNRHGQTLALSNISSKVWLGSRASEATWRRRVAEWKKRSAFSNSSAQRCRERICARPILRCTGNIRTFISIFCWMSIGSRPLLATTARRSRPASAPAPAAWSKRWARRAPIPTAASPPRSSNANATCAPNSTTKLSNKPGSRTRKTTRPKPKPSRRKFAV